MKTLRSSQGLEQRNRERTASVAARLKLFAKEWQSGDIAWVVKVVDETATLRPLLGHLKTKRLQSPTPPSRRNQRNTPISQWLPMVRNQLRLSVLAIGLIIVPLSISIAGEGRLTHYLLMDPPTKEELTELEIARKDKQLLSGGQLIVLHGRISGITDLWHRVGGSTKVVSVKLLPDAVLINEQKLVEAVLYLPNQDIYDPFSIGNEIFFVVAILDEADARSFSTLQVHALLLFESKARQALVFEFAQRQ